MHDTKFCPLYTVNNTPIQKITHYFFEKGHSQSEVDSVHARIEIDTKKKDIYTPLQWMDAVQNAKISEPRYTVKVMETNDILDFKSLVKDTIENYNKDENGNAVKWIEIHALQYRKDLSGNIFFKYGIGEKDFSSIELTRNQKTRKNRRKTELTMKKYHLKRLYKEAPAISNSKYKDLMKLCEHGHVPRREQRDGHIPDTLPEPDQEENSDNESQNEN